MIQVHEKLQELLTWSGMTQFELADKVGIPRGSINSYVSGRTPISVELAYQMAPALKVSPWTLLNGEPLLATAMDLSAEEAKLVTDLRGLTTQQRELIDALIETMKNQNKYK